MFCLRFLCVFQQKPQRVSKAVWFGYGVKPAHLRVVDAPFMTRRCTIYDPWMHRLQVENVPLRLAKSRKIPFLC